MTTTAKTLTVGTRTSQLAMWQTHHIISRLQAAWPDLACQITPFVTQGDKTLDKPLPQIGGKGLFTAELERALLHGDIDIAVHSLKDLPVEDPPGLTLGAIASRADVRDGLVARDGLTLEALPPGAVVGTSSNRRKAQLLAVRPDLDVRSIRGNVETRVRKVQEGQYDAAVLAAAGLQRLEMDGVVTQWLSLETMLPAPGQAALGVQCRADDADIIALLAAVDDTDARTAVTAERTFLAAMGGGCSAPIAAHATVDQGGTIHLAALVGATDGSRLVRVSATGTNPRALGSELAAKALAQGAADLLDDPPRPLQGRRVIVTRSREQAQSMAERLAALGAIPIVVPAIQFEPLSAPRLDDALANMAGYDWLIFTSGNAVSFFFERLDSLDEPPPLPRVAASGSATARKLAAHGITPDFVPGEFVGEALAAGLGDLRGQRVLLPRARSGRPEIVKLLQAQGAQVDDIALYDTVTAEPAAAALAALSAGADAVTFTSPSSVRNFLKILANEEENVGDVAGVLETAVIACIGPITAAEARQNGLNVAVVPATYTIDDLLQALSAHFDTVN